MVDDKDVKLVGRIRQRLAVTALLVTLAVAVVAWVVSVNQVDIEVRHDGSRGQELVVAQADTDPIVISITPDRRADGALVLVDGRAVPHPPGEVDGELLWFVDDRQPGRYILEVRVSRPSWFAATKSVSIEIRSE